MALKDILTGSVEGKSSDSNQITEDMVLDQPVPDGLCVECGDQPAESDCLDCQEPFCSVCFNYLHRTGKRKSHKTQQYRKKDKINNMVDSDPETISTKDAEEEESVFSNNRDSSSSRSTSSEDEDAEIENNDLKSNNVSESQASIASSRGENGAISQPELIQLIKEHTKYIPMRLTSEERKLLRLLEAALNVSEYVDNVDVLSFSSKSKRMITQLKEMCSILAGLVVATDMDAGQSLFEDKEFAHNSEWFQSIFEIGRRYKIMNPEKMRDSFGKLMYMIMDSRLPEVQEAMEFDLYKPIKTVFSFLKSKESLSVLDDELILTATAEIVPNNKSRIQIQAEIKRKERSLETIARRYAKPDVLSQEEIRQCLYSISDYHAYLRSNRQPVEELIKMLDNFFDADEITSSKHGEYSLGISYGRGGARLSHNHSKQYHYVKQSLTLWSQIMRDMFMLWKLADDDLLSDVSRYRLSDTGQGLNRIKSCPSVARAMHNIIHKAQMRTGTWIGSSVVHLGDHAVPNALFFLDKYLQVPRILNPVYLTVTDFDRVAKDPFVTDYIDSQFGSLQDLKMTVLSDFFKHAFDGSGADNFYDAGSCIDGRLTSAWNWTNTIAKKHYYKMFLITGFSGFNGSDGFS